MAKSLMSAAGGGKVTVTGLTPEVVLDGKTVMVNQGRKTAKQVEGTLDVLVFGQITYDGPDRIWYWDGSKYAFITAARNNPTITVAGTFKKAIATGNSATNNDYIFTVGGNTYRAAQGMVVYDTFTNNQINFNGWGLWERTLVVLGSKA